MSTETLTASDRPMISIRLVVNGQSVTATVEPREFLLDFLRNRLGLTGAKRSCDTEVCGACTVLLDGSPISSCSTLVYEADGHAVTTIEGLEQNGELHPIQKAFIHQAALQCGFCTPGMILTIKSMLDEIPHPTPEQVRSYLHGNLCRCTGYWNILKAVEEAARLLNPTSTHEEMRP